MRLDLDWMALLDDGGILHGDLTKYDDLFRITGLRERVREFWLIDLNDDRRRFLTIHLPTPDLRLVYRRIGEVDVHIAMGGRMEPQEQRVAGWLAGWQKTVRMTVGGDQSDVYEGNAQSILLIRSDGHIESYDRTPPGFGINVRPHELEAGLKKEGLVD